MLGGGCGCYEVAVRSRDVRRVRDGGTAMKLLFVDERNWCRYHRIRKGKGEPVYSTGGRKQGHPVLPPGLLGASLIFAAGRDTLRPPLGRPPELGTLSICARRITSSQRSFPGLAPLRSCSMTSPPWFADSTLDCLPHLKTSRLVQGQQEQPGAAMDCTQLFQFPYPLQLFPVLERDSNY
jgi:hypothetical protein